MNYFEQKLRHLANYKKIIDLGCGIPFQKDMKKYKGIFKDCMYITVDNVTDFKPDIIADIADLPFDDEITSAVVCKAVLEHCKEPHKVVDEIHRILKPHGKALLFVPFLYSYHGNSQYKDYFRFTKDGIEYLFREFNHVEIVANRGRIGTLLNLLPFKLIRKISMIIEPFDKKGNQTSGYYIWATK